jgi:competence ComEA-like helix-hairpin-helix protein
MVHLTLQEKKILWFVALLFALGAALTVFRKSTGCSFCLLDIYGSKRAEPIDMNTATREQWVALPGIGEKLADAILAERTRRGRFISQDDLLAIPGITEKRLSSFRDLVKV